MREKLRLSDLSILYVCLSEDWNTIERRCLADATYFRNIGGSPFILCHQHSLIDREAEKEALPRLHFSTGLDTWRSKLNFYFQLQHILQKQQVDIIHTYNYNTLLPLGMMLKGMPRIPLVFTYNENLPWSKHWVLDRYFVSRTDSVFTFSGNIRELALETLPVNQRKVHVTGAGIDFPARINRSQHAVEKNASLHSSVARRTS